MLAYPLLVKGDFLLCSTLFRLVEFLRLENFVLKFYFLSLSLRNLNQWQLFVSSQLFIHFHQLAVYYVQLKGIKNISDSILKQKKIFCLPFNVFKSQFKRTKSNDIDGLFSPQRTFVFSFEEINSVVETKVEKAACIILKQS